MANQYAHSVKAIKELKEIRILQELVNHYKTKFLNNILDQEHRQLKGPLLYGNSFKYSRTDATIIKGIEVVSALYKETRREISLFEFSP